jgi:hypothetical protein
MTKFTYDPIHDTVTYICPVCNTEIIYYVEYLSPHDVAIIGSKSLHWVPNPAICTCGHSILWHPQNYGCCLPTQFQECDCRQFVPMPDIGLTYDMLYICSNCYSLTPKIHQLHDFLLSLDHRGSS